MVLKYEAAVGDDAGGTPSIRRVNRTQKFQVSALTLPAGEVAHSVMLRSAANRAAAVAREIRNVNVYVEAVRGGTAFSATSRDSPKARKKSRVPFPSTRWASARRRASFSPASAGPSSTHSLKA